MNTPKHPDEKQPGGPIDPNLPDTPMPDSPDETPPIEAAKDSPIPTERPAGVDARDGDPQKLAQNRDKLGVDDDHLTPDMKEGHRGTYP